MSLKNNNSQEEMEEFFGDKRIKKHLLNMAKEASLSNPSFRVKRAVTAGNNFVADVYRAVIEGEKGGKTVKIYTILKCAPIDPKRRQFLKIRKVFLQEIFFYETILSVFDDLLRDYGMSVDYFPKLYGASDEDKNEALALEDLKPAGYVMREIKFLDYKHARATLRNLGRFHAYSFATRVKRPEIFETLKSIQEPLFDGQKSADNAMHIATLTTIIKEALADEDDRYITKFEDFASTMRDVLPVIIKESKVEPYAVVNLGDVWSNNILFKYKENEESNGPQDLRFLDFQLCRYASPALDVSYTLFCGTTHETRVEHYDELLREYYESFSTCLQQLDCDASVLFPYEVFLDHIQRFGKYAAGMAIFVLHIFTDQNNQVVEISSQVDEKSYHERLQNDVFYRETLRKTFKEFVDRNII